MQGPELDSLCTQHVYSRSCPQGHQSKLTDINALVQIDINVSDQIGINASVQIDMNASAQIDIDVSAQIDINAPEEIYQVTEVTIDSHIPPHLHILKWKSNVQTICSHVKKSTVCTA